MLIDTHTHTDRYSSCSMLDAYDLVERADSLKLDGLVITEHHYVWTDKEISKLKSECRTRLIILKGQEIVTSIGDLLVFGYEKTIARYSDPADIINTIHEAGGVVILAHPFRGKRDLGASIDYLKNRFAPVDGIEIYNGNQTVEENAFAASIYPALGNVGIGSSDAHSVPMVGRFATEFEDCIRDKADLIKAIRAGRCKPVCLDQVYKRSLS